MIIKFFQDLIGITDLNQRISEFKERRVRDAATIQRLNNRIGTLESKVSRMNDLFHIGVDLHIQDHNRDWAVVCLNGKQPMVQFFGLGRDKVSPRDIIGFFGAFSRVTYDAPSGMRELILHETKRMWG